MADFRLTQTGQQVQDDLNNAERDNVTLEQHVTNGNIHVTLENKDTWNSKYNKPSGGIPKSDLAEAVQAAVDAALTAYQKPGTGIPKSDLASAVQSAIDAALTAYQKPGTGIPKTDLAAAVQSAFEAALTAYQKPNTGIPQSDMSADVQSKLNAAGSADAAIAAERLARETADLAINEALGTKVNATQVSNAIAAALADYDTSAEVASAISTAISTALANYYTKTNIDALLATKMTQAQVESIVASALASYSTTSEVSAAIASALTDYYTKTAIDAALAGKQATLQFDLTPTLNSSNPVTSEGIRAAIAAAVNGLVNSTYVQSAITTALADYSTTSQVSTMISTAINSALQAYATKEYVSSQVQEYAGTFRGTYDSLAELQATTGNHHNDYAWVQVTDSDGDNDYDRYKYNGTAWVFEYRLNNTHFTAAELAAIRSGITTEKVASYDLHLANTTVHITSAERQTWNAKQNAITDGAQIGLGYGVCSTDATTADKTASISNFILFKNGIVSIRFTKAVAVPSATLNISSTGAKPIYIGGIALQPGVIRPGMTAIMQYDGTNWNIIALQGLENSQSPSDLYVDMGLPSGLLWARKNIDVTQANGFAASEYQYECTFFSWGNTQGHNPAGASSFSYDWGSGNDGPYASTPGAALNGNASPSFDFARANCGAPWRLPTTDEFAELFNNIDYIDANGDVIDPSQTNKLVTIDSIVGIYLKSKINGNRLFFPCSGYGDGTSWNGRGSDGYYWSSSLNSATHGRDLGFRSGGVYPRSNDNRFYGFAGRAVQ